MTEEREMDKTITARNMLELRRKVYEAEGWTRVAGESYGTRINSTYTVKFDAKADRMIATRKECA
jgi:hypothetical protein